MTEDEANYEFDKFMNHYLENEEEKKDWQLVLQKWFMRAGDYKRRHGAITVKQEEVRSTVPWYNPADAKGVGELLNKVRERLNGSGGKTNGLGSHIPREGEETKA